MIQENMTENLPNTMIPPTTNLNGTAFIAGTEPIDPSIDPSIDPDKLLVALYWIWDAFERTNMPFFLVKQTAKDVMAHKNLTGNKVTVGVRRNEWISGARRILDAFIQPIDENENVALYEHQGVPIEVYVYEDHDCIINTDMIRYRHEEFKLPNPYSTFEQIYG